MEDIKNVHSNNSTTKKFNIYWGPWDAQELIASEVEETNSTGETGLALNKENFGWFNNTFKIISNFLKEKGIKSYYSRFNLLSQNPIHLEMDYGSYTMFFYIKEIG